MVSIEFYPIDITYRVVDGKAIVVMWGVTIDGRRVCVQDHDFRALLLGYPKRAGPCSGEASKAQSRRGQGMKDGSSQLLPCERSCSQNR